MKHYPSRRYHPELGSKLVQNEAEDQALAGWFQTPADFGVETCPGRTPDPSILANRPTPKLEAPKAAAPAPMPAPELPDELENEIEEVLEKVSHLKTDLKRARKAGKP